MYSITGLSWSVPVFRVLTQTTIFTMETVAAAPPPAEAPPDGTTPGRCLRWGLLLPICYRGEGEDVVWGRLGGFAACGARLRALASGGAAAAPGLTR